MRLLNQTIRTKVLHKAMVYVMSIASRVCRNILSFKCLGVFTISNGGSEERWVRMHVHGQSFLMNQIRKMVGLAVAVFRGLAAPEAIHWALDPSRDFSTPMAPELGLFLCESKFDTYNQAFGNERERLDLQDWKSEVEDFKLVCATPLLSRQLGEILTRKGFMIFALIIHINKLSSIIICCRPLL
jgi:tRNA pseudouridine38-40 synthase